MTLQTLQYDRFNLEAEIMSVWNTKDDLVAITSRMMDDPDPMTEDEIANVLIGLSELHDIRCKKLFNVFESMVKNNCFIDVYKNELEPKHSQDIGKVV